MRIVVTGGAGFIGAHAVEAAVRARHEVLALDDLSTGSRDNLAAVAEQIAFERLDVRDRSGCREAFARWQAEAVLHLAAVASPLRSIEDPDYAYDVNLTGTYNVLEAARLCGARRFVFPGSAAGYGPEPALPSDETDPTNPVSPYAAQKLAGELMAATWRRVWGLETVSLRFFNVFGERQPANSAYSGVISIFIAALRANGRATITGDGEQTRDFIYVGDVVRAIERALTGDDPGPGPYNVGRGQSLSVRRLYSILAGRMGLPDEPLFTAERAGDVRHSRARVERMRAALGIEPELTVEQGLDRLLAWSNAKVDDSARSHEKGSGVLPTG